jgi:hypothetical protein
VRSGFSRFPPPPIITPWSAESLGLGYSIGGGSSFSSLVSSASAAWPTTDLAIYVPFTIEMPSLAVRLAWYNGATSSGNVDCGIYSKDGTRLVSAGATGQGTINVPQLVTISYMLRPGQYYMALWMHTGGTMFRVAPLLASYQACSGMLEEVVTSVLPAVWTPVTSTTLYVPVFGVGFRTLI